MIDAMLNYDFGTHILDFVFMGALYAITTVVLIWGYRVMSK